MAILVLMVGVPGSGKSTWIQNNLTDKDVWVSRDAIRYNLLEEDDDYFAKENEVIELFINNINNMLNKNFRYVYADATHLHPKGRAQLLNNLKIKPDAIYAVYIDTPLNITLERNAQREGRARVPDDVIKRMYRSVSLPTARENINTLFFVNKEGKIDNSKTVILKAVN